MFVRETWKIATVLYEECPGFGQSNIAVLQMGSPRSRKNSLENLPLEASIFSTAWIKTVISFKKKFSWEVLEIFRTCFSQQKSGKSFLIYKIL